MAQIDVKDLRMQYGDELIQEHVSFSVPPGCIFAVMGGSGCGKSTLLRHMVGLQEPARGDVCIDGQGYWGEMDAGQKQATRQRFGMLFQDGALFSSLTLRENVEAPFREHTDLPPALVGEAELDLGDTLDDPTTHFEYDLHAWTKGEGA